jgi:hypothetical protein
MRSVTLLRLVHILFGVYWAGTIFFFATYLEPTLRALGPDGGKVMIEMFRRRYLTVLPVAATLTVLSGVWLLSITSGGFDPVFMGSRMGVTLSVGGLAAIGALLIGVFVMRPAAMRIWGIARAMPTLTDDATRAARMAEMTALRARTQASARIIFVLLLVAVVTMAIARYL